MLIPIAKIKKIDINLYRQGYRGTRTLSPCYEQWKMKSVHKVVWQFIIKLNVYLLHGRAILLLNIYINEMKACPHKDFYLNIHSSFICISQKIKKNPNVF